MADSSPHGAAPARNAPSLPEWDKLTPAQREARRIDAERGAARAKSLGAAN